MNLMKKILVAQATVLALWAVSAQATTDEEIAQRIKPVGEVCVQGQECANAPAPAAPAAAASTEAVSAEAEAPAVAASAGRSGEDVYNQFCTVCHSIGLLDAPKTGDTAVWEARAKIAGGLEGLLKTSISGINAMPPKGTCSDCTDDELLSAIKSMSGL
ncbi:cytochrome c5 family protein [Pseudomonas sp. C27(2019)]|uniref:c-type cytochrome n=1 Tax=Pseudomonas sp. C27(2019) TaxID=2604941 RepID=UPI001248B25C|nr:c-type cytochrome [Pseudomonas sp. C27(2019)]QEY57901.1 cytochrome c5 family protein [Pseudomonas sp. C27(2019)]